MKFHRLLTAALITLSVAFTGSMCAGAALASDRNTSDAADQSSAADISGTVTNKSAGGTSAAADNLSDISEAEREVPPDESTGTEGEKSGDSTAAAEEQGISFSTYRGRDSADSYHSFTGEDGIFYLFLPSDANLARVTVQCSEKMKSTTLGRISGNGMLLSGDFSAQPASIILADGTRVVLVCVQSALPSLSLRIEDADLEVVHADEDADTKVQLASTILTDPMDPSNNLSVVKNAELKGRGNSSWAFYDKKGYQIKFEKAKPILGMKKAKKWVLLANSSDATLMRNKIVFDTARALDLGFAPECRYADLWIDGDYRGVYLISEKVEIGKNRLNLTSGHGILAEFDNAFFYQEDFFKDVNDNKWALKDYQTDDASEDFLSFQKKVNALATALNEQSPWEEVAAMIDEVQFAKFYLTAEYFLNEELATTSFYWYSDGSDDELHVGPVWDFDTCMADGDPANEYYVWHNVFFKRLLIYSEFTDMLNQYYEAECRDIFELAPTTMDLLRTKVGISAEMNYLRFNVLGTPDVKDHMFYPTYEENLDNQKQWLRDRMEQFSIENACGKISDYFVTAKMSDDNSTVTLTFRTKKDIKSLQFYVQTEASGGADRTAYEGVRDENGNWVYELDLIDFNQVGEYIVEAFINGTNKHPDATVAFTVDSTPTVSYVLSGVDYSPVFDPEYYENKYSDAKSACGGNPAKLFDHFVEKGMKERRQGSEDFDVEFYMKDNPDLVEKFGTDYAAYYEHYCDSGKAEGRQGTKGQTGTS